jgi:hypothetical protein
MGAFLLFPLMRGKHTDVISYASVLFLYKLSPAFDRKTSEGTISFGSTGELGAADRSDSVSCSVDSVSRRMRTLFWLATSSFALPSQCTISSDIHLARSNICIAPIFFAQLVLAATAINLNTVHAQEIMQCFANFVSVICVAFATSTLHSAEKNNVK